ncbi:MAG: hypothetical protein M3Y82_13650 [Verrucomicrobiota bacterium]|nr:hypothetical protein [Verrucomicrobiota bacterium]
MKHLKIFGALAVLMALAGLIFLKWNSPHNRSSPVILAAISAKPIALKTNAVAPNVVTEKEIKPIKKADGTNAAPQFFPVLADFSQWANQFSTNKSVSVAEGEKLARARRAIMLHLIKTDPEKALAQTVPVRWRRELPASVTQYFEEQIDARGALNVAVATDFDQKKSQVFRDVKIGENRWEAFVYGRRLAQVSQASIPIHGIAIDKKMALHVDPVRVLEPEEVVVAEKKGAIIHEKICGVSKQPSNILNQEIPADLGGEVVFFCRSAHLELVKEQLIAAESGGGIGGTARSNLAADAWTQGPKTVLYMRVNFPDDLREPISEAARIQ